MIKPPKLRDQAAEQTQRYIVMNKLVTANRLPIETQIAKAFGVNLISMSEATKSLEFLGIVEKKAEWQIGIESHRRLVDLLATAQVAEATEELRKHTERLLCVELEVEEKHDPRYCHH